MMQEKIQIELFFKAFCWMKATDHLSLHYFPIPSAVALCNALMYYLYYIHYECITYQYFRQLLTQSWNTMKHVQKALD